MKQLRYLLEAALLFAFLSLSKILGVSKGSALGGWVGRTIGPRLAASRKARRHLDNVLPDLSDEQATLIIRDMWDNLGRVMMEYAHLDEIARNRTDVIGGEILEQYQNLPVIMFSAHLGNWEACPPAVFYHHNFKVSSVYRAPNNPYSDKMLLNARSLNGQLSTIRKSKKGTRALVKQLQNNEHIGMLIDQKYNEGIEVDFFDRPAMTSPIYVHLAQKFDCPLIPLRIIRLPDAYFHVEILPPLVTKDQRMEDVVDESHSLLEKWIMEYPGQWLWLHRRWINDGANDIEA